MPLPSSHPFLVVDPSTPTPGSVVRRGLIQWSTPDTYTRASGTQWSARFGNALTMTGIAGIATSPGGRCVLDVSSAAGFTDPTGLAVPTALAVDVWVLPTLASNNGQLIYAEYATATRPATRTSYVQYISNASGQRISFTFGSNAASTLDVSFAGSAALNVWTHLALVIPGSGTQTCTAYWNGVPAGTLSVTVTRPATTSYFVVCDTSAYRGLVGDFKVYNVALDANEVKQNYNAMAPYYGRPPIA